MSFFSMILVILPVLISVAFITLLERKVLSLVGFRVGPNKVSFVGLLQPLSDALKLSNKQFVVLSNSSIFLFNLSSIILLVCSLICWCTIYSNPSVVSFKYPILILMVALGIGTISNVMAGWSTFNKFSLLGSMRSVAQLVSYESNLYLCLFFFIFIYMNFIFSNQFFVSFLMIYIPFCFLIWIPTFLAELQRTPYDFSEGESELVSGFNVEYGSNGFTLIFLSEYSNLIFLCMISSIIFCSGCFSNCTMMFFFVLWVRSVLPRYRFDKLMLLSWKFFIPFLTVYFLCLVSIIE